MGVYNANWEDEENSRIVELVVEYRHADDRLELVEVTPASVTFFDPQSKLAHRRIKVCTNAGRRLLLRAYRQRVGIERLEQELSSLPLTSC